MKKSQLAIVMGIVILIADLYWTATSYTYLPWLASGIAIFVADIVWLAIDFELIRGASPDKQIEEARPRTTARQ